MLNFTKEERIIICILLVTLLTGSGITLLKSNNKESKKRSNYHQQELRDFHARILKVVSSDSTKKKSKLKVPIKPIDINRATTEEFESLPCIGKVIAQRIVDYRTQRGKFNSIEELLHVKGIGNKTLDKLLPYIKITN